MVKAPDETCGWWKLRIKGLGVIKFRPSNETRLMAELAAGGKVSEIRVVHKAIRVEVHLAVRTTTPNPKPPRQTRQRHGTRSGDHQPGRLL